MNFDPVEAPRHYRHNAANSAFDPLKAQEAATEADELPSVVSAEIDKLRRADRVIFHFPLWWFSPPALLKGWFDRVLAHGAMHSVEHRFDNGRCLGKKILFCVTTGSSEAESSFNGKEGDVQMLLWPTAYTLRYLGCTVLIPEVVHGVHGYHRGAKLKELRARLRAVLKNHDRIMAVLDERPVLSFNADSDFDTNGRLKANSPSHSLFTRQTP
jgi:NAD(P)H dehydrogenase (quinone)